MAGRRRYPLCDSCRSQKAESGITDLDGVPGAPFIGSVNAVLPANAPLLDRHGLVAQFQRAKPRGRPMPAHIVRGNAIRGRVRARVEHVFAEQKRRLGLIIRSVGLVRATTGITLVNLAYNMRRLAWLAGRRAPA